MELYTYTKFQQDILIRHEIKKYLYSFDRN